MDNAIKYSNDHPQIKITTHSTNKSLMDTFGRRQWDRHE